MWIRTLRYLTALVVLRLSYSVGEAWGGTDAHLLVTTCLGLAGALLVLKLGRRT